jgi:hypothetical protein
MGAQCEELTWKMERVGKVGCVFTILVRISGGEMPIGEINYKGGDNIEIDYKINLI